MLKLEAELPKRAKLSFWPFLDLCVIGMFFVLFSSKFVMTPGITLALPEVESSQVAISPVYEVIAVTEVKGEEMIFFKDSKFDLESLEKHFDRRGAPQEGATLLVKADVAVSMRTLSLLSELAIKAGYSKVQLATEERRSLGGAFGGGR
ncbi:biopolymer transporter ExbD [Pelagicoccus sp. NFK12]|uniref:Biopolymer transporter ExbD n=1 Tax=Pelagicoccus enzymogenes TaxID=2773457 RepID=A0A927FDU3_9BACT|nr:biopolymer transporter ExbD [Pelagicoccus enzymogenes]MBD5782584.1 biopolymer transporter ExbD [Pelagicoccus enzymogenes]MDQ8199503.1 biopolymer transporter ExbD [Pelagicoccus enzymogenes]